MEAQEALMKIEEINKVIQSSNKAVFSGRHMAVFGIMILLIPVLGHVTTWLTFGHDFGAYENAYTSISNTLFYWGLAILLRRVVPRSELFDQKRQTIHPLIKKAFSVTRPIVFAIIGVVMVLSMTNQAEYIYPIVLILLGLMFAIFGKFSIRAVSVIAWMLIAAGLLHLYLIPNHIPSLGMYFLVFNGFAYLVMSYYLIRSERSDQGRQEGTHAE